MQKVFWTQGAKVSKKSFAPPKTAFAPVQNVVAPVQEALCSLGPKDLLHPPLSTFGNFTFRSIQGGPGTEPEPETGTVGTVFAGTERGTGTA